MLSKKVIRNTLHGVCFLNCRFSTFSIDMYLVFNHLKKGGVMKIVVISIFSGLLLLFSVSNKIVAQDFAKVSPKMNKVLADNKLIHALEVTMAPGEKSDMHSHPAHFYYALTDGKLIVHYADGKKEEFDMKAGGSGYSDPERPHIAENGGDKILKFLVIELKEHPYKAEKVAKEELKKQ